MFLGEEFLCKSIQKDLKKSGVLKTSLVIPKTEIIKIFVIQYTASFKISLIFSYTAVDFTSCTTKYSTLTE